MPQNQPIQTNDIELVEEIVLGSTRGGRKGLSAEPLIITPVRGLTEADVPLLQNPPPMVQPIKPPQALRHSHHNLARLLASGRSVTECSLITGYSIAYISTLKGGKDFKDLLAYYNEQKDEIFVDVMERMRVLGLSTLDEIQSRLESEPEGFTKQQLMDLAELMLVKGGHSRPTASGGGNSTSPQIAISVNFGPQTADGEMVDVTPRRGPIIEIDEGGRSK